MAAYDPRPWHDLLTMSGGATAALAGLIFVAVALNHEAILEIAALPALAARTLSILIGILVLCVEGLVPAQGRIALGVEVLATGLVLTAVVLGTTIRNLGVSDRAHWRASLVGLSASASVPAVVAGASLLASAGGGLFWLAAEIGVGVVVAAYYGWILLIEIRR